MLPNIALVTTFLNLEKGIHVKKHIRQPTVNNSLTTDPCTILSEQKRSYKDLYKSRSKDAEKDSVIDDFLSKLGIPKLSENQKQQGEGKITIQECEAILKSFQEPGNDGMPIEFYKKC